MTHEQADTVGGHPMGPHHPPSPSHSSVVPTRSTPYELELTIEQTRPPEPLGRVPTVGVLWLKYVNISVHCMSQALGDSGRLSHVGKNFGASRAEQLEDSVKVGQLEPEHGSSPASRIHGSTSCSVSHSFPG